MCIRDSTATALSFRLIEMACHPSYPLKSEKASPPGTLTVYLSCAKLTRPPKTASHTVAIPTVSVLLRFIQHLLYQVASSRLDVSSKNLLDGVDRPIWVNLSNAYGEQA